MATTTASKTVKGFRVSCPACHGEDATVSIDLNDLRSCRCSECDWEGSPQEAQGEPGPALRPVPLAQLRAEVLALYAPPLRAKATALKIRQAFRLLEDLGCASAEDLTPVVIARYLQSRAGTNATTTHGHLRAIRVVCTYACEMGYLRINPFLLRKSWIRLPRESARAKTHHSREEIARVLAMLRSDVDGKIGWPQWRARRLHAVVAVFAYTGLRKLEGLRLWVGDVDLVERILMVRPRGGSLKTVESEAPVPIPEPLVPILSDWLAHRLDAPGTDPDVPEDCAARPIRPDCPWLFPGITRVGPWTGGPPGCKPLDRLRQAGDRAGVADFTFLSLRHSWATHAEAWGLSELQIARVLRHTSTRTAREHYRHADAPNLREMVKDVRY